MSIFTDKVLKYTVSEWMGSRCELCRQVTRYGSSTRRWRRIWWLKVCLMTNLLRMVSNLSGFTVSGIKSDGLSDFDINMCSYPHTHTHTLRSAHTFISSHRSTDIHIHTEPLRLFPTLSFK